MDYKPFKEFKFWFLYKSEGVWTVIDQTRPDITLGGLSWANQSSNYYHFNPTNLPSNDIMLNEAIECEWEEYKKRPEHFVGCTADINGATADSAKAIYQNLLTGLLMCRAYKNGKDPDEYSDYISNVLNWINSTDFYTAPASTIYHESFPHGLLYHTLTVYNCMLQLYQIPKFQGKIDIDSATLCCLVHDWCKIGLYEQYKRNVKNEVTNQWERVDAYKRSAFPHTFGHGVSSMYMAMKMFKLTEEEALGIRWHMGKWNVSENEVNEFQQANEHYPMVHLIQFADQLAITEY